MSQRSDDCYRQVELATDELIEAMGVFRAAVDKRISDLVGRERGDGYVLQRADAVVIAMQSSTVKDAIQDAHWAAEKVNAFGMAYQCAVTRVREKQDQRLGLID